MQNYQPRRLSHYLRFFARGERIQDLTARVEYYPGELGNARRCISCCGHSFDACACAVSVCVLGDLDSSWARLYDGFRCSSHSSIPQAPTKHRKSNCGLCFTQRRPNDGAVVGMHAKLRRENMTTTFAAWYHKESGGEITLGSGVMVGPEGVSVYHHFGLSHEPATYTYEPGEYTVEFFATIDGENKPRLLTSCQLSLSEEMAAMLAAREGHVRFNWNPNTNSYKPTKWRLKRVHG